MNFLVFPSISNPHFYISDNKHAISFFIHNFLFSRKAKIQMLINLFRRTLPDPLFQLLLKLTLNKTFRLPDEISSILVSVKKYMDSQRKVFKISSEECKELGCIIRMSTWEREDDKFVIIIFSKLNKPPIAVVKVGTLKFRESIKLEYDNTSIVYDNLKDKVVSSIPRPITFFSSDRAALYFEETISGAPVNNYLKLIKNDQERQDLFVEILGKSADFLCNLYCNNSHLTSQEIKEFFIFPIDSLGCTEFGNRYAQRFSKLKAAAGELENCNINSVWMHGDFWGGSILYNKTGIGIIDWEFFTEKGMPLWDFFSLAFHVGVEISSKPAISSDFMNYFNNPEVAKIVDEHILSLADKSNIKIQLLPFLFQCYLLYNMLHRDTVHERYWQNCLEKYWSMTAGKKSDNHNRLL